MADVYDSETGTKLLIPQGSKLVGSYERKSVKNGRVPVTFKLLMLPNGGSWTISENIVAIDGAWYSGRATANLINMTSSMLRKSADVENTVTIETGYEFNIYVTNNITFWKESWNLEKLTDEEFIKVYDLQ